MLHGFDSLIRDDFSHRPPGRPPLDDIDLALTLLDRGDHFDRVDEWLDQHQPPRAVIVLPAAPSASYEHFVCRIVTEMHRNLGRDPIDLGPIPARSRVLDDVLTHLANRLRKRAAPEPATRPAAGGGPDSGGTSDTMAELMRSCRQSVIFSHVINHEFLNARGRRFLAEWVRYFTQTCPTPASGRVLAFLCLQSTSRDDVLTGDIRNALASTQPGSVLWAEPLPEIPAEDVAPWAVEIRGFDRYRKWNAFFSNVHMGLFESGVTRMPFERIREKVLELAQREVASFGPGFREIP